MTLNMLIGILEQGLIYGIMAMGLLITYRILDFPDLTVDSSFPLGAAVSATLTLQGVAPWLTLLIGCAAGRHRRADYRADSRQVPQSAICSAASSP